MFCSQFHEIPISAFLSPVEISSTVLLERLQILDLHTGLSIDFAEPIRDHTDAIYCSIDGESSLLVLLGKQISIESVGALLSRMLLDD